MLFFCLCLGSRREGLGPLKQGPDTLSLIKSHILQSFSELRINRKTFNGLNDLTRNEILWDTYSPSYNLAPPISRVLIGQHLMFFSLTSPMCCNSPRKCSPVKYKNRQKAGFPIATQTTSMRRNNVSLKHQVWRILKLQVI